MSEKEIAVGHGVKSSARWLLKMNFLTNKVAAEGQALCPTILMYKMRVRAVVKFLQG
jgi:hypothetical protein